LVPPWPPQNQPQNQITPTPAHPAQPRPPNAISANRQARTVGGSISDKDCKMRSRGLGPNRNRSVGTEPSSLVFVTNHPWLWRYIDEQTTRVDAEYFQGRTSTEADRNHSSPATEGPFQLAFRLRSPRRNITQIRNALKPPRKPRRPSRRRPKRMLVRRSRGRGPSSLSKCVGSS